MRRSALASILLTFVLIGAACSQGGSQSSSSASGAGNDTGNKPMTIRIAQSHGNLKYAMQAKDDDVYIKELSRLTGYDVHIEFLGHGTDYTQQMTVRFASKDLPDLIKTTGINDRMHPGAVEQGIFAELGPLIDQYAPNMKANMPEDLWKDPNISKDGKIYAIPVPVPRVAGEVIYIRQDWLDKLQMKQPETIDDYLAFFEAVKKEDMDGNGNPNDEYGFFVRENLSFSDLFFEEFGAFPTKWMMRDGQMTPGIIMPEMKDALVFWKMMYDKGYVNPNLFTNKSADWIAGIVQGKAGMWKHQVGNYNTTWKKSEFVNQPDVELSLIGGPQGPQGKGLSVARNGLQYAWVIPSSVAHPEEIVKFLDWFWTEEGKRFVLFGIEGDTYTVENGEVRWDFNAPAYKDNEAYSFHQTTLNYQFAVNNMSEGYPALTAGIPDADKLMQGFKVAEENIIESDGRFLPDLKTFQSHPELVPGTASGTLFLDMFAKVVTGREEIEPAFDSFVQEWKRRGGDEAMQEATEWYHAYYGK